MQTGGITSQAARDDFLLLLVTQLRHQDPLDPIQQQDFLGQLAQFSTLEGVEQLNASFADLLRLQELTQGSTLLGRTVAYTDAGGATRQGTVEQVGAENNALALQINGGTVAIDQVQTVLA